MFLFDWIATAFSTTIYDNEAREWILDQMVIRGEWVLIKVAIAISKLVQVTEQEGPEEIIIKLRIQASNITKEEIQVAFEEISGF